MELQQKSLVIVAGAAGELGREAVRQLTDVPYIDVLGLGRNRPKKHDSKHTFIEVDLSNPEEAGNLDKEIKYLNYGAVHWLHAVGSFTEYKTLKQHSAHEIYNLISSNFISSALSIQLWLRLIEDTRAGNFLAFSSLAVPHSFPMTAGFCAAKAGVEELIKATTNEVLSEDITLNCVRLPTLNTPIERQLKPKGDIKKWLAPAEAIDFSVPILLDRRIPRNRGAIFCPFKTSPTYFGTSVLERYGASPEDLM